MRVHHITSNYSMFLGGAERMLRDLHLGLRERNIESYILGSMQQKDPDLVGTQSMGFNSAYNPREIREIYCYLTQNARPGDIIHAHQFPPIFYVSLLSRIWKDRYHYVCTEHSTSNRRRGRFLGTILDTIIYSGYEQVITVSAGVEQELLKWRPELQGRTRVIFNGTKLYFDHVLRREPNEPLKVLSIGNLRPAKNYESALKAVALIRDLEFEYQIAGEGKYLDRLLLLSQELGLESKVRFLGFFEAIPDLLASADIFLMPSLWEGFGIAAVEAMNASLPLVVSAVPGLREIVESEHPCAVLVDPESPESIAAGLKKLLLSPDLRFRLGSNAFAQSQKFGVDQMVENYRNLYDQIL